ncbi:hypothetical protein O181_124917 [Austropuccinia psidii MF-1]|uniref:Uncharacterized protein n=1 Tax=Austropuccinia psidii MF-1 TaxID=1389203 RepID=A0A9Q3Q6X5_9BASI|nr:hypothetical protein [Austropuccinia psidii MF-1]
MRPKGGNHLVPKARWVPNHNWTHLSQFWPPIPCTQIWPRNPLDTNLAINPVGPPWTIIPAMASGTHQRPPDQLSQPFPQLKGNSSHSSMHPVLKVAGVDQIPQFQIKVQNPTPNLKEYSLTQQSGNPWQQSEDHSRIPITWPCRIWVSISFRITPRAFSEVIWSFNQLSRPQVFQYSSDNSMGPYRHQSSNLYVLRPSGPI